MLKTNYIKLNIEKYNYEIISGPHIMMSNSSILEKVIGQNWLAAGDASVTFDPISSNGILTAIKNGIFAADIVIKYINKKYDDFEIYNKKIMREFYNYLINRNHYYNLEKRWINNIFWKQNQQFI